MKTKPNVEPILSKKIPIGYKLVLDGWSYTQNKLKEKLKDGTRKLLTLDVSISPDKFVKKVNQGDISELAKRVDLYYGMICPNNCRGCFEKGDVGNFLLSFDDVKKYIEEALRIRFRICKISRTRRINI